ncbi:MAG: BPTD_3080 family restriction endonuclease [Coraliomargarita sp.]
MTNSPNSLIINSPYECPKQHWAEPQADGALAIKPERRPAGYEIYDPRANTRRTVALDRVNEIRKRVDAWREAGRPGITSVTRRLLEHWADRDEAVRQYPFYFCQYEAIETLIWCVEAPAEFKQGVAIPSDGGLWERICNKMATGTGKTTVMAMIITWQVLNALTYPKRKEFSAAILIVAPGLTVKERLQVLQPGGSENYYDLFALCPSEGLRQKLNQMTLVIENWHTLMPKEEAKRSVVKKGRESDEAFTRRVLGKLAKHKDLIVINDEAHHAYRVPGDIKISKKQAAEQGIDLDEATRWIEGLDRIHKTRRILRCFDLSATPFAPTGKKTTESALFEWIVSDFGLNDAIEAGLVKTPRVVVRDDAIPDAKTYKSRLYHLYNDPEVKDDLNRRAAAHEPLPQLVQTGYNILASDWLKANEAWRGGGHLVPPVILSVCNRVETAARVEHFFNEGNCLFPELHAPTKTLRVDSKILEKAEKGEKATANKDYEARLHEIVKESGLPKTKQAQLLGLKKEELLREIVDNVGKPGRAGQSLQNVVSVAMLSEGWDAKNVTHILGLRAFTSQLLCEQVIGRGLRRVSYDTDENGLFKPEYVNVFGVPLSIFQDVGEGGEGPPPPKPTTQIEVLPDRNASEIQWPNVLRIESVIRPKLEVDWDKVESIELDPSNTPVTAELAPALGGQMNLAQLSEIDLTKLSDQIRLQHLVFKAAKKAFDQVEANRFSGSPEYLMLQLIQIVDQFWGSDKLYIPSLFHQDDMRRRLLFALNSDKVVQHIFRFVRQQNEEEIVPVFDTEQAIGSTANMRTWYTTKPCHPTIKSQISHSVFDSTWEAAETYHIEKCDKVDAYAKNDHLGFHVYYMHNGVQRRFVPDFLVRLTNGKTLILEVKGRDSDQNKSKREQLDRWVAAINKHGGFGNWCWDVSFDVNDINDILLKHS